MRHQLPIPWPLMAAAVLACLAGASQAAGPGFQTTTVFPFKPENKPNYRIPALIQAANGDLLAFAEKRNDGIGDLGNHDIVLKRSADRGRSWSGEILVFDDGDRTCTDITPGIERTSGKLWLFFLRNKKEFCRFTSLDHGATWQGPVSIHAQVTKPEWESLPAKASPQPPKGRAALWEHGWSQRYGCGPGHAMVQLQSGRLVVPARHREDVGRGRLRSFAHSFFSDDGGETWKPGGNIGQDTSECQLAELTSGELLAVCRNESAEDAPDNMRHLVSRSGDGGETWSPPRRAEELITPRCHGCVERYDRETLLFCSPASPFRQQEHPYGRYNLTVRLSRDEGRTWSAGRTVWPHPSSYSDLAALDDGTIALVYERGPKGGTHYWDEIQFARFDLDWLNPP